MNEVQKQIDELKEKIAQCQAVIQFAYIGMTGTKEQREKVFRNKVGAEICLKELQKEAGKLIKKKYKLLAEGGVQNG